MKIDTWAHMEPPPPPFTIDICSYLDKLTNIKYRKTISKIRLSLHNLNIEIGRHRQIERNDRKCPFCDLNELEDE